MKPVGISAGTKENGDYFFRLDGYENQMVFVSIMIKDGRVFSISADVEKEK